MTRKIRLAHGFGTCVLRTREGCPHTHTQAAKMMRKLLRKYISHPIAYTYVLCTVSAYHLRIIERTSIYIYLYEYPLETAYFPNKIDSYET